MAWNEPGNGGNKDRDPWGQKGKELFAPLRIAFTGKMHGPDLQEVMVMLGRRGCLKRTQAALYEEG